MPAEIAAILMNREVIAVDQDPLGAAGTRVQQEGELEVWARPLSDGSRAVVLFNRGRTVATIAVRWSTLGLREGARLAVRDLWAHRDLGERQGGAEASVPAHGVVMWRVAPRRGGGARVVREDGESGRRSGR